MDLLKLKQKIEQGKELLPVLQKELQKVIQAKAAFDWALSQLEEFDSLEEKEYDLKDKIESFEIRVKDVYPGFGIPYPKEYAEAIIEEPFYSKDGEFDFYFDNSSVVRHQEKLIKLQYRGDDSIGECVAVPLTSA